MTLTSNEKEVQLPMWFRKTMTFANYMLFGLVVGYQILKYHKDEIPAGYYDIMNLSLLTLIIIACALSGPRILLIIRKIVNTNA